MDVQQLKKLRKKRNDLLSAKLALNNEIIKCQDILQDLESTNINIVKGRTSAAPNPTIYLLCAIHAVGMNSSHEGEYYTFIYYFYLIYYILVNELILFGIEL